MFELWFSEQMKVGKTYRGHGSYTYTVWCKIEPAKMNEFLRWAQYN